MLRLEKIHGRLQSRICSGFTAFNGSLFIF
jgi:hypothetical protein